ncbi:MAG: prepilin-type N-terminal cleavage/methylation domain-containing protein [Rubrivivax sp.]|nr:prepilin-type N-terminal cleavage/methylation domain-containing protein [Rubrivivax sp.]
MNRRGGGGQGGFTLVEVLVALFAMALLAGLAWQGLDSVLRARNASKLSIDDTTRLSTVLTQWEQDLVAVFDTEVVPALGFDGQTLRLTRRVEGGVALVAWSLRSGKWQRWAGPAMPREAELQELWLRQQQFQGNEAGQLAVAAGASEWQIYFHQGSTWSNAQSTGNLVQGAAPSANGAAAPARQALPNAVRLVITLDGKTLTRDIALGPQET